MRHALLACCLLAACTPDTQNLGFTPVGSPRWAVALGTIYDDGALATAIDSIGDVVAVGYNSGPADMYGSPSVSSFVTKRVASDGSERWTVQMLPQSVDSYANAASVAIDAQDSVIVTGDYIGTVDFGGQTLSLSEPSAPSHSDLFVAKYTWDGHLQWVRGLSPTTNVTAAAVAVDSAGRIVVAGMFSYGALTFGTEQYTADTNRDAFIAVFDPSGALVWGHAFEGGDGPLPASIAISANDDVIVAGQFTAPASFGGATLDPGAPDRGFIARYRKDGLFLSSQVIGAASPGMSLVTQVAASPAGLVVQTMEDDGPQDLAHPVYAMVRVLDDSGQEMWSRKLDDHGNISPQLRTLALAPSGLIVSSAWDDKPSGDAGSMEVVSYDPLGHASTTAFGNRMSFGQTVARGSVMGATGSVAFTGDFSGMVDFGAGPLTTHGQNDTDAYIVLLDPPM
jgi:hypothetical protein